MSTFDLEHQNGIRTTLGRCEMKQHEPNTHSGRADPARRRQQTADSRQQTADSRQQTADSRQQTADSSATSLEALLRSHTVVGIGETHEDQTHRRALLGEMASLHEKGLLDEIVLEMPDAGLARIRSARHLTPRQMLQMVELDDDYLEIISAAKTLGVRISGGDPTSGYRANYGQLAPFESRETRRHRRRRRSLRRGANAVSHAAQSDARCR